MQSSRILAGEGFGGVFLAGDAAIVEDERVEVAVAGVENVGDAKAGGALRREISLMILRERGAGDDAVLHDVVGGDAAHGGEGGFASFPDEGAFDVGLGDANFARRRFRGRFRRRGHEGCDFGDGAVEFDEEERAAIGIVGVDGGFGGLDREACPSFRWRREACLRR